MPRLGFSIVPLDPFYVPARRQLEALETQCKADFLPLDTSISVFDTPKLNLSPENEVYMTCPKCGSVDKDYKWLELLPPCYRFRETSSQNRQFFDCLMNCCNQASNILDFDFRYPTKELELGAGFASAQVDVFEVKTRSVNSGDLSKFAELMGCPIRLILITS